jgi:hypothetical protein
MQYRRPSKRSYSSGFERRTRSGRHGWLGLAALALSLLGATSASASCTTPFSITTTPGVPLGERPDILCTGPWSRSSALFRLEAGMERQRFYCAADTVFSMWGNWECHVQTGTQARILARANFCVERNDPAEVDLRWAGGNTLDVNARARCSSLAATGFLGHTADPVDADIFDFSGSPGEQVRVLLTRDQTAGSTVGVATLRLTRRDGQVIAQRTGSLPLRLDTTLTARGVEIRVLAAGPAQGTAFRGDYVVEVQPASGNVGGRRLVPRRNVEP